VQEKARGLEVNLQNHRKDRKKIWLSRVWTDVHFRGFGFINREALILGSPSGRVI
jgi:hypothetical protein